MINPGNIPPPGLFIYIGATFNPLLTWTDYSGNPIDLTGYTGIMEIRPYVASDIIIATLGTSAGGLSIPNPLLGQIQILLTAAQTALLTPQGAVCDLQLTAPGPGEVDYLIQGQITIQQMVTR